MYVCSSILETVTPNNEASTPTNASLSPVSMVVAIITMRINVLLTSGALAADPNTSPTVVEVSD